MYKTVIQRSTPQTVAKLSVASSTSITTGDADWLQKKGVIFLLRVLSVFDRFDFRRLGLRREER